MKRALLLFALFFIVQPQFIYGQSVNKGSIYIGAIGDFTKFDNYGFGVTILPRFEYLVGDRFSIGSDFGVSYSLVDFQDTYKYGSVIVSPFIRYYFLNRKISPITEVELYHGFKFDNSEDFTYKKYDTNIVYLSVGISTPGLILNRVGFDLTTGFGWYIYHQRSQLRYAPLTSIRITYFIRRPNIKSGQ